MQACWIMSRTSLASVPSPARQAEFCLFSVLKHKHELLRAGIFNHTQDYEELVAEFSQLYPVEILETFLNGSLHNPGFNISALLPSGIAYKDPKFFDDTGSNITSSLQVHNNAI